MKRAGTPLVAAAAVAIVLFGLAATAGAHPVTGRIIPHAFVRGQAPPTTADCQANDRDLLLRPRSCEKAYNLAPSTQQGMTGEGETIVIVDSFGSPTIQNDLHAFDQAFGLPGPAVAEVIAGRCGTAVRLHQRRHDRLGRGDDARRRVRARDGAEGEHPARRDSRQRDGRRHRASRRSCRPRTTSSTTTSRRDLAELRGDRGDVPEARRSRRASGRRSRTPCCTVRLDLLVLALDRVVSAIGEAERGQRRQHGQNLAHEISPGGIGANYQIERAWRQMS